MRFPQVYNHTMFDEPRGSHVTHFTEGMNGAIPPTTDTEKTHALWVLAGQADSVEGLRDVAEMLGLIDPPPRDLCAVGHEQFDHGVTGPDGQRYCLACNKGLVER